MERLTDKAWKNLDPWEMCGQDHFCGRGCHDIGGCNGGCIVPNLYKKLAQYEDAEEQGRLVMLPCKVGDKVKDIIADYIFTVQKIETVHVHGKDCLIFRCGNEGMRDYMAFYDFEIGNRVKILTREEAEKALEAKR